MDRHLPLARPSVRDLLLRSDFGRANPSRVDELLARYDSPLRDDHSSPREKEDELVNA